MTMLKRISALALVIALVACCLPFSVSALTYSSGDFYFEISGGNASVVKYKGTGTTTAIPDTFNGYPFTKIDDETFYGCSNLTSIKIPKSVTTIGDYAFQNCSSLKRISVPASVTGMGTNAFKGCTALEYVEFNANINAIPNNTFYNCVALEDMDISSTITAIGNAAFYNCSSLSTVPTAAIESYGQRAFDNSGITSLVISERVANLPYYTFANCNNLESVVVFGLDTVIDDTAFFNSSDMTVYCKINSTADTYADENYYDIEYIDCILGDANDDGFVTISDVTAIQKYRAKMISFEKVNCICGDVNGDNEVTIRDATTIQMYIAKYLDKI